MNRLSEPSTQQDIHILAQILIIDDEPQARRMLRQALERAGYEVVEAQDGNEGIRRFRAAPTELIITDILMPGKEGLETIVDLRREFPDVKIIAMTGGGRAGNLDFLEVAGRLGARRTLRKPFELRDMIDAVRETLEEQV